MKLTTKLVNKFGSDRLLHFFVCACIVLAGGYFGELGIFISFCISVILSVLKEYVFDEKDEADTADYVDLFWGLAGSFAGSVWSILFSFIW